MTAVNRRARKVTTASHKAVKDRGGGWQGQRKRIIISFVISQMVKVDDTPWNAIEKSLRKLRQRIFRAIKESKWNLARSLMKLMLRSYFNLLMSVRMVTQRNAGKKTAGVDGEVALTPQARMALVQSMGEYTVWKANPTRRIYIPKAGKPGQQRPLGIPTIRDRVAQAIVKNALEPSWEARFEPNNFGFRPEGGRNHESHTRKTLG